MMRLLAFAVMLCCVGSTLHAQQEPIVTDRPDQTESASIVPAGWLQVEGGVLREFSEEKFENSSGGGAASLTREHVVLQLPGILLRLGLNEQVELRLGMGYTQEEMTANGSSSSIEGLDAFSLGTKVAISKEDGLIPQSAILATVTIPGTGAEHFETEWLVPEIRFSFAHTLSDRFSFGYNLAAMWDGESARHIGYYSVVIGAGLLYDVSCYAEVYGELPGDTYPLHRFDAGFTWLLTDDLQLDASYGVGLTDPANDAAGMAFADAMDSFVSAGVSWRFPVW